MAGEGGSAGKGLLAVGVRALVRALSRVCSAMSGKRAAVAEGLCASLAVVRLLSSVHSLMHGQGRPLDKLLAAVRPVANVRTDSAVDALVTSEITASRETLSTSTAWVGLDRLLRRRRGLLRHLLHVHVGHAPHVGHFRIARELHRGWHRVWDVHRRLHGGGRRVCSGNVRVGVLRVFRTVGRGGSFHAGFVLNERQLVLVIEKTGVQLL